MEFILSTTPRLIGTMRDERKGCDGSMIQLGGPLISLSSGRIVSMMRDKGDGRGRRVGEAGLFHIDKSMYIVWGRDKGHTLQHRWGPSHRRDGRHSTSHVGSVCIWREERGIQKTEWDKGK